MAKKPVIYVATCLPTGKQYVGFSSKWNSRRKQHVKMSKVNRPKTVFHRALRKYGPANFSWEVVDGHDDPEYCLNVLEPAWIIKLDTLVPNGLNMTLGGGNWKPRVKKRKRRYGSAQAIAKAIKRKGKQ